MKVAEVKPHTGSRITLSAQTEVDFILDDLFSVGPLDRNGYNDGANILLRFNNVANPTLTVHFPIYSVGHDSRVKLIADWKAFLECRHTLPPELRKALDDHRTVSEEALSIREAAQ
jgi:hypothetical protein